MDLSRPAPQSVLEIIPLHFFSRPVGAFWGLGQAQIYPHVQPCEVHLVCTSHTALWDTPRLRVSTPSLSQSHTHPLPAGDCALLFSPSPAGGPHSNPQWLCHADAAVRGVCGAGGVRHLQVQKVGVPLHHLPISPSAALLPRVCLQYSSQGDCSEMITNVFFSLVSVSFWWLPIVTRIKSRLLF